MEKNLTLRKEIIRLSTQSAIDYTDNNGRRSDFEKPKPHSLVTKKMTHVIPPGAVASLSLVLTKLLQLILLSFLFFGCIRAS